MRLTHEVLPSGMTATFVNSPRYQTTSARLNFKAGSLHQDPTVPYGVAHFLEHTPFQGTDDFPSVWDLYDYVDYDGSKHNAWTDQVATSYSADGLDPFRVMNIVFQLGFHPLLTEEGLNADRNAVIEEAREDQYHAYRPEIENYYRLFGGERYSALVQGNVEDVEAITHQQITDFYQAHYQSTNAQLIVCSPASLREIRRITNELASRVDTTRTNPNPQPVRFDLPWLTHPEPVTTFHNDKDEEEAQSGVSVGYHLEMPRTFRDYVLQRRGAALIKRTLHNLLRDELNLVYSVSADVTALENLNHGIEETYYALEIHTSLVGSSVIAALSAIDQVEETIGKNTKFAEVVQRDRVYQLRAALEAGAEQAANQIGGSDQLYYDDTYDPAAEIELVNSFTAKEIAAEAERLMTDRRLTNISGPDKGQLKKAARYAKRIV